MTEKGTLGSPPLIAAEGGAAYEVPPTEAGTRLDKWFRRHFPNLTAGRIQKMIRIGSVRIDGRRSPPSARLAVGNILRVPPIAAQPRHLPQPKAAAEFARLIIHKDPTFTVINKPRGMAVQGGSRVGNRHLDRLLDSLGEGALRPRLVHRLDKQTSGALIVASSAVAAATLAEQFRRKQVKKIYWGLVCGVPRRQRGSITLDGEQTIYEVTAQLPSTAALLRLEPISGKKHQLRRHCLQLGTPLHGDSKYALRSQMLKGIDAELHLHAVGVEFAHPQSGERVVCRAPPPPYFGESLRLLGLTDSVGWWRELLA